MLEFELFFGPFFPRTDESTQNARIGRLQSQQQHFSILWYLAIKAKTNQNKLYKTIHIYTNNTRQWASATNVG